MQGGLEVKAPNVVLVTFVYTVNFNNFNCERNRSRPTGADDPSAGDFQPASHNGSRSGNRCRYSIHYHFYQINKHWLIRRHEYSLSRILINRMIIAWMELVNLYKNELSFHANSETISTWRIHRGPRGASRFERGHRPPESAVCWTPHCTNH